MTGFWDKLKKGAQEAGEKAAQLGKITKIKAEIASLNSSKKGKLVNLGSKIYSLYKEDKLQGDVKSEIQELLKPIEDIEKEISEKEKRVEVIRKEMEEKKEEVEEKTAGVEEKINKETSKAEKNVKKKVTEEEEKTEEKTGEKKEEVSDGPPKEE